jgi:hypothetical protein
VVVVMPEQLSWRSLEDFVRSQKLRDGFLERIVLDEYHCVLSEVPSSVCAA